MKFWSMLFNLWRKSSLIFKPREREFSKPTGGNPSEKLTLWLLGWTYPTSELLSTTRKCPKFRSSTSTKKKPTDTISTPTFLILLLPTLMKCIWHRQRLFHTSMWLLMHTNKTLLTGFHSRHWDSDSAFLSSSIGHSLLISLCMVINRSLWKADNCNPTSLRAFYVRCTWVITSIMLSNSSHNPKVRLSTWSRLCLISHWEISKKVWVSTKRDVFRSWVTVLNGSVQDKTLKIFWSIW